MKCSCKILKPLFCCPVYLEILEVLLEQKEDKKSDVNIKGHNNYTALHAASCHYEDNIDCVNELLHHGIDGDAVTLNGDTAFTLASQFGHKDILMHLLLFGGADINHTGLSGKTALCYSAEHGFPECIAALREHHADANIDDCQGNTPLHWAVLKNYEACVRELLEFTIIDVFQKNREGKTAIKIATDMGYHHLAKMIW